MVLGGSLGEFEGLMSSSLTLSQDHDGKDPFKWLQVKDIKEVELVKIRLNRLKYSASV
jgi:hypothetical protein